MQVTVRHLVEYPLTFLHQDDYIYRLDSAIRKLVPLFLAHHVKLAQQEIRTVTETTLAGELIPDTLYFNINQTATGDLYKNVHDDQGAVLGDAVTFSGKNFFNVNRLF